VKILLASPIDPAAVVALERDFDLRSAFKAEPAALREAVADREVVVVRSGVQLSADVLSAAPNLRLVLRAGSGLDNIDLDCARQLGVRVVRVPGMSAPPVAEFTFALLLSLARKVTLADSLIRQGRRHYRRPGR
jgi:D-3-phosphoglycerate dehydrogenase / 2-oxoglutarate reductase